MGRQINFFVDRDDAMTLVAHIGSQGDRFIDKKGNVIVDPLSVLHSRGRLHVWSEGAKIIVRDVLDVFNSEVIEFTSSDCNEERRALQLGRFWYETYVWDPSAPGWARKSPELDKRFNLYKRYVLKNFRKSSDGSGVYAGPGAYERYKEGWKLMLGPILSARFD